MAKFIRIRNEQGVYKRNPNGKLDAVMDPNQVDWNDTEWMTRDQINSLLGGSSSSPADPFQQSLDRATGLFKPVREAGAASFGAQRGRIGADFGDLETRLRQEAVNAESGMSERFNQLGLLQSGLTAAGTGKIRSDLTTNLARKDIERTIAEADLALKEAGFNADIGAKTLDLAKSNRQEGMTGSNLAYQMLQSPGWADIPPRLQEQILQALGFTIS
ncbi:MAG: hypothetical protein NUV80_04445 [Candidatus Berkelbacteria bacterium]|nr:hypothetical protein [Candidatus Berkelbacteria bacterium]